MVFYMKILIVLRPSIHDKTEATGPSCHVRRASMVRLYL